MSKPSLLPITVAIAEANSYRMGSRSHSNLALTGHLGELSPPQLRVLSLQNQQPALGAADASIDQINLSQKSLHFFV